MEEINFEATFKGTSLLVDEDGFVLFKPINAAHEPVRMHFSKLDLGKGVTTVKTTENKTLKLHSRKFVEAIEVQHTDAEEFQEDSDSPAAPVEFSWTDVTMKLFFQQYSLKKKLLDKRHIKTQKGMFAAIASAMQAHGHNVTSAQVENKYKLLAKKMKSYILRNLRRNGTSRSRKVLPYQRQMMEMFGKKHTIVPARFSRTYGTKEKNSMSLQAGIVLSSGAGDYRASGTSLLKNRVSEVQSSPEPIESAAALDDSSAPSSPAQPEYPAVNVSCRQNPNPRFTKKDGATAVALSTLKEAIMQQTSILETERVKRLVVQREMVSLFRQHIIELKRSNDIKEEGLRLQKEKIKLLQKQVNLLGQLVPSADNNFDCKPDY